MCCKLVNNSDTNFKSVFLWGKVCVCPQKSYFRMNRPFDYHYFKTLTLELSYFLFVQNTYPARQVVAVRTTFLLQPRAVSMLPATTTIRWTIISRARQEQALYKGMPPYILWQKACIFLRLAPLTDIQRDRQAGRPYLMALLLPLIPPPCPCSNAIAHLATQI